MPVAKMEKTVGKTHSWAYIKLFPLRMNSKVIVFLKAEYTQGEIIGRKGFLILHTYLKNWLITSNICIIEGWTMFGQEFISVSRKNLNCHYFWYWAADQIQTSLPFYTGTNPTAEVKLAWWSSPCLWRECARAEHKSLLRCQQNLK